MTYKSISIFIILLCIIIGVVFFFGNFMPFDNSTGNANVDSFISRLFHESDNPEDNTDEVSGDVATGSEVDGEVIIYSSREGWLTYIDPVYAFSFEFPAAFKSSAYEDDVGNVRVFENTRADAGTASFQIFIMPFDEEGPISAERIKRDVSNITIHEPQQAIISKDKLSALIFKGTDPVLGETREVWFPHNGHLYQITAPIGFDTQLAEIMNTWQF